MIIIVYIAYVIKLQIIQTYVYDELYTQTLQAQIKRVLSEDSKSAQKIPIFTNNKKNRNYFYM